MIFLRDYVTSHSMRGACTCGRCIDAPENPQEVQPTGHIADMIFFKVTLVDNPNKEEYERLVRAYFPQWLDGKEHGYFEIGADLDDQGVGLQAMGLGYLLGLWNLLTPRSVLGAGCPDDIVQAAAGQGLITIQASLPGAKPFDLNSLLKSPKVKS